MQPFRRHCDGFLKPHFAQFSKHYAATASTDVHAFSHLTVALFRCHNPFARTGSTYHGNRFGQRPVGPLSALIDTRTQEVVNYCWSENQNERQHARTLSFSLRTSLGATSLTHTRRSVPPLQKHAHKPAPPAASAYAAAPAAPLAAPSCCGPMGESFPPCSSFSDDTKSIGIKQRGRQTRPGRSRRQPHPLTLPFATIRAGCVRLHDDHRVTKLHAPRSQVALPDDAMMSRRQYRHVAVALVHLCAVAYFLHLGVAVWCRVRWEPMASITAALVIVPLPAVLFMIQSACAETEAERIVSSASAPPYTLPAPRTVADLLNDAVSAGAGGLQVHSPAWNTSKTAREHCAFRAWSVHVREL